MNIFDLLINRPLGYILFTIYKIVGSYGIAILLFTIVMKILLLPISIKTKKSMMDMQRVQPLMKALEKKYKTDKQKYQEELAKLYQEEGVSPLGGCGTQLIQFPIIIGLYGAISKPLTNLLNLTADQITKISDMLGYTGSVTATKQLEVASKMWENADKIKSAFPNIPLIDFHFLGINLGATPQFSMDLTTVSVLWLIPIISCATAVFSTFIMKKYSGAPAPAEGQPDPNKTMYIMMPAMSLVFGFMLPAGLGLYWIAQNLLGALQEVLLGKYMLKKQAEKNVLKETKRIEEEQEKISKKKPNKGGGGK